MRGASPSKETETMTDIPSPTPIVCRPQALSNEERSRSQSLRTELAGATQETKELPTGYAFRYRPDATLFQKAAEWITLERRCCPFLTFELGWQQGDDSAPWLAVTGPQGTKEFLAAEMPELPSAK
jgi:hypothetical protein